MVGARACMCAAHLLHGIYSFAEFARSKFNENCSTHRMSRMSFPSMPHIHRTHSTHGSPHMICHCFGMRCGPTADMHLFHIKIHPTFKHSHRRTHTTERHLGWHGTCYPLPMRYRLLRHNKLIIFGKHCRVVCDWGECRAILFRCLSIRTHQNCDANW